jgi:hypothetical protein
MALALAGLALSACSSSSSGASASKDAAVEDSSLPDGHAPADAAPEAGDDAEGVPQDAGTDAAATCDGAAPLCFGEDTSQCCPQDPLMTAACHDGAWMCGAAPAPGCNSKSCFHDAATAD